MFAVRRLIAQRHLAVLICVAALALKLWVPTGYMINSSHGRITITICSGFAEAPMTMEGSGMDVSMPGQGKDHGKAEMPCAFSGLSAATLGAIDPVQLVALIAFVMAAGLTGFILPVPWSAPWLRPPLRAPPIYS